MASQIARHRITVFVSLLLVLVVRSEWTNELTLTSNQPLAGGIYGRAVHTFGDFVIVGDYSTASVYIMPDSEWVEQAKLTMPAGETTLGSFGASVGLEASIAVVGAPHLSTMGTTLASNDSRVNLSASVFAFGRDLNTWSLQAKFTSLQPGTDGFGYCTAIGGSYLVIGAPYAYDLIKGDGSGYGVTNYGSNGASTPSTSTSSSSPSPPSSSAPSTPNRKMGAVYTYKRVNNTWVSTGVLVPFISNENDRFGWSVDISSDGTKLVVGAPADTVDGTDSGSAYVYSLDTAGNWNLDQRLTGSDEESFDNFGYSVAIDVSDVVVGTASARKAYIFHKTADSWIQDAKLVGSDTTINDGFGQSVSIFGTYAVVGSPLNMGRGAVYLWELDMDLGSWVQLRKLTASLPSSRMGACVTIGSRFLLAGAPSANHDIGHALTLMLDGSVVGSPVVDSIEDTAVLIRFSGDSTSMDLLTTRKIIADAAGTGTAQTEVRIVDLQSNSGPIASHLFGLQVRFTTSPTMSAGTAAQNLLAALPDIRYRLNAAVGAISGTAEIIPATPPNASTSKGLTLQQSAALVMLILVTIFTIALLVYFTVERRKKIAADKREFDALEAEKEAKREREKKEKSEKKFRMKRPQNVLRQQKRKTGVYMQAENDAAGLSFSETFLDSEDFPLSPRGMADVGDYDPTASLEDVGSPSRLNLEDSPPRHTMDDGPRILMDDGPRLDFSDGPRIALDLDDGPRLGLETFPDDGPSLGMADDGPRINMEDGPRIAMDDGPRIGLDREPLDDGPSLRMSDPRDGGPSLKLSDDGPKIPLMSGLSDPSPKKIPDDDGPKIFMGDDGPGIAIDEDRQQQIPSTTDDGPSFRMSDDGPSLTTASDAIPASSSSYIDTYDPTELAPGPSITAEDLEDPTAPVPALSLPTSQGHDSGNESDSGSVSTPTRSKRPANVPKLNIPGF